jgi:tetratricopeptide (TPR) repeat protein
MEVRAHKWGTVAGAAVLVVVALGIGYQGVFLAADNAYLHAKIEPALADRTTAALRAIDLNPLSAEYRGAVGLVYLDEVAANMRAAAQARQNGEDPTQYTEALKKSFADAESAFKDAIAFAPDEYENYVNLASIYNAGGAALNKDLFQSAIDVAERGLELMPFGTAIRVQLAKSLLATGKTAEAVKTLEYCVHIDPRGGSAALVLASVYQQQGRAAEALALLKSVEALAPGQTGVADAIKQLETGAPPP